MKTMKTTLLAIAVSAAAVGTVHAQEVGYDWRSIQYDIDIDDTRNTTTNDTDINTVVNTTVNTESNTSVNQSVDQAVWTRQSLEQSVSDSFTRDVTQSVDQSLTSTETYDISDSISRDVDIMQSHDEAHRIRTNTVEENITRNENVNSDIRRERNEHGVSVNLEKDLSLSSDIAFSGDPTITGEIALDSAAIAVVDNRQSVSGNIGMNDKLDNSANIRDNVGSDASGNLLFNVASGDNNVQDNAAALSAADAGFAFGLADAEVFVHQTGMNNMTMNKGVANDAYIGGDAFSAATGNIGVNIASGNNNAQKNAMAASVATAAYAQASVSSNQVSSGNVTTNAGSYEKFTETTQVALSGPVRGWSVSAGVGAYEGTTRGTTESEGMSHQASNFYADLWTGSSHPNGNQTGHADFDNQSQGAIANPGRPGVGGLAFDNESEGTYEGTESGQLGFVELGYSDLQASLSGTVATTRWVAVAATNDASLSGNAFSSASGNIGVNVAAGSGNLQANSLSMAVAQPGAAAPPPGGGEQ